MKNRKKISIWTIRLLMLSMIIFGIIHIVFSIQNILLMDYNWWNIILINIQLIVEIIVVIQSPLMLNTIVVALIEEENEVQQIVPNEYPQLDVYVPIRSVKLETLRNTLEGLANQDYPDEKFTIFVCDDTPDDTKHKQYKELTEEIGGKYIYEPSNVKYKSGMLNLSLPHGNAEYVAFFDYDQAPLDGILKTLVEVLLAHPDKAFVQAKKKFRDLYNLSRVWSALLYVIFFELMLLTKRRMGTVIFAGSTAVFRRTAIEKIGGIPEDTFTEDNETATKMLVNGQKGIFIDKYGSLGTVPTGYRAQISQLWRWSQGGAHVFHNEAGNVIKSDKLTLSQKIDTLSILLVTPSLAAYYFYILTFVPFVMSGVDSVRLEIYGISSLIVIPIFPGLTYIVMSAMAIQKGSSNGMDLHLKYLPGFLIIGLTSNLLIISSGIFGILGKYGPDSKRGKWTRHVHIMKISVFATIIGIIGTYYSYLWLMDGITSAIILFLISLSLIPTLPVSLYYDVSDKKSDLGDH